MSNFKNLIEGDQPVLVDFYADWCGPCQMLAPTIEKLAKELKGTVKVIKVDVDKAPQAAQKFSIKGVPTLILFHQGEIIWRKSGVLSFNQLKQTIEQQLSNQLQPKN